MAKLGFDLPQDLEDKLRPILPWGAKTAVIEELLWQLAERGDPGEVYMLVQLRAKRKHASVHQNVTTSRSAS